MNDLLFAISIMASIIWSAGFFAFKAGVGVHIFLVIAVTATIALLVRRKRSVTYINKTVNLK